MSDRQKKLAPLNWKRHELSQSAGNTLRMLTRGIREKLTRSQLDMPPASTLSRSIWFPELPDDPVQKAIRLLQAAAEVEHGLMVQYLYAGYGFRTSPNRDVMGIAIEEMSHLMTVQNLLKVIGAQSHLARQEYGPVSQLYPFELLLEPLSKVSLAKYVVAESPEILPVGVDPVVMNLIVDLAIQGSGESVNRVGTLYALLGAVFGSEQFLLQKASTGDPWYVNVNALANEAATFYGGRDKLHLPDGAFVAASAANQGSDLDWDRSVERSIDEFRVHVVVNREQSVEALRDIGLQGEGPSAVPSEEAHFKRFYNLFIRFFGASGTGTSPIPGVASVPAAPVIVVDETSTDPNAISHPDTVRWAKLSDHRYAILLGALEMYLRLPASERGFLRGWCFAEMFAISRLAQFLARLPRNSTSTPVVAAVPFNLPDWSGDAVTWDDLIHVFTESVALIPAIQAQTNDSERSRILYHLLSSDRRKLEEAKARKAGNSTLKKVDKARDVLDWAAGAGNPQSHDGNSPNLPNTNQGRFWNLQLDEFKLTDIFGENIVAQPAGNGDSLLMSVLRDGSMPSGRPPLPPTSAEFQFLEAWIRSGCPDEPA